MYRIPRLWSALLWDCAIPPLSHPFCFPQLPQNCFFLCRLFWRPVRTCPVDRYLLLNILQTSSISVTWEVIGHSVSQVHLLNRNLYLNEIHRWLVSTFKFQKHWPVFLQITYSLNMQQSFWIYYALMLIFICSGIFIFSIMVLSSFQFCSCRI